MVKSRNGGFTLIELLVVVVFIGVLAWLAIPELNAIEDRTKQTEAKMVLRNIWDAEREHYKKDGTFWGQDKIMSAADTAAFEEINIMMKFDDHYKYTICKATRIQLHVRAENNLDGDSTLDVLEIFQDGTLKHTIDDIEK